MYDRHWRTNFDYSIEVIRRIAPADLRAVNIDIHTGNGSEIPCQSIATVTITFQGLKFDHPMYVASDVKHVIIGYDFLNPTKDAHISPSHNSVFVVKISHSSTTTTQQLSKP